MSPIANALRRAPWAVWSERTWLILLIVLAIIVRLGYVLVVGKDELTWGDEFTYNGLATNLLNYGCFCFVPGESTMWRAPLYPVILALIYSVFGANHFMVVLALQALSGGLTALLLALIGKQISGSIWVGLLAGVGFALNPLLIFAAGLIYSEAFYLPILLAAVYLWMTLTSWPSRWAAIAIGSGVLLGLSVLMKPNLMFFPIWLIVWGWAAFRSLRRGVLVAAVVGLAMLTVLAPWFVRNYAVSGRFSFSLSLSSAMAFYQGNNPMSEGGGIDEVVYVETIPELQGLGELEKADTLYQWGFDWIRENPEGFLRLVPLKIYRFFSPLETSVQGRAVTPIDPLIYGAFAVYYALGIIGAIQSLPKWRNWVLAYMLILYPVLLTVVFYGGTRYGLVAQPFVKLFVALALVNIVVWIQSRRHKSQSVGETSRATQ